MSALAVPCEVPAIKRNIASGWKQPRMVKKLVLVAAVRQNSFVAGELLFRP